MKSEILSAVNFVLKIVRGPQRIADDRLDLFHQTLIDILINHYEGHWFPQQPTKGSAYRCLQVTNGVLDKLLQRAALTSGIKDTELISLLPSHFTIWIDPSEVSYRIGEEGSVGIIYEKPSSTSSSQVSSKSQDDSTSTKSTSFVPEVENNKAVSSISHRQTLSPVVSNDTELRTTHSSSPVFNRTPMDARLRNILSSSPVFDWVSTADTRNVLSQSPVRNLYTVYNEQPLQWRFRPLYVAS